jgi:hypothetical protein
MGAFRTKQEVFFFVEKKCFKIIKNHRNLRQKKPLFPKENRGNNLLSQSFMDQYSTKGIESIKVRV